MLWGCFAASGPGNLQHVEGTMDSVKETLSCCLMKPSLLSSPLPGKGSTTAHFTHAVVVEVVQLTGSNGDRVTDIQHKQKHDQLMYSYVAGNRTHPLQGFDFPNHAE
ncbi:hypothetical protein JOQ06_025375 [Pogonophryne albipinna]|uniref:Uncharacterized protein n=1 Tax=Pogonophryne albipinna TaxID=1090488 RepID=A0AAD6ATJ0_9TELE|nr:hypothetical protein JOQ06_025375 [Pogonophryne albipinna]